MGDITMVTPVDCSPTSGDWQDVDLDSYVTVSGTPKGVILRSQNDSSTTDYAFGLRMKGSTDARVDNIRNWVVTWSIIGVDASNIFQVYRGNDNVKIYIVGYVTGSWTFLTNATDMSINNSSAWTDKDLTSIASGIKIACFEAVGISTSYAAFGVRKNGSSDNLIAGITAHVAWPIVGCDADDIFEYYNASSSNDLYLVGYYTGSNLYSTTNAIDWSISVATPYTDCPAGNASSTVAVVEINSGSTTTNGFIRKNGSSEDLSAYYPKRHCWAVVELDASQLAEGKIGNTACDFWYTISDTAFPASTTVIPIFMNQYRQRWR